MDDSSKMRQLSAAQVLAITTALVGHRKLPRDIRIERDPISPAFLRIDAAPPVERPFVPARPKKVLPFVNHQARYKKLRRDKA